jgi:outer membrane protein OmpA-like peptidoglycan-associated protein
MKNVYSFLAFFLSSFSINAQELIFNGSFEEENNCSEFRVHCSPVAWYSTSTGENAYGYRNGLFFPKKGRHCSEFIVADMQQKTFIQTWLICAVEAGKTYRLSFWLRKKDKYDLLPIGLYFSNQFEASSSNFNNGEQAQVKITRKNFNLPPRKGKWRKVNITFIAPITADYMTIGNFDRFMPKMEQAVPKWYLKDEAVTYAIDDVSLKPVQEEAYCPNMEKRLLEIYHHRKRHTHHYIPPKNESNIKLKKEVMTKETVKDSSKIIAPKQEISSKMPESIVLPSVFFAFDQYQIQKRYQEELLAALVPLRKKSFTRLEVIGHTDNIGNDDYNLTLSKKRAETIANLIISNNFCTAEKITFSGKGATAPIADNNTEEGRQTNRRVVILIY